MLTSNNYIQLKNTATDELVQIIPNTEIIIPAGEYINLNEARITKDGKTVELYKAGQAVSISPIFEPEELDIFAALTNKELKNILIDQGISYPSKAKRSVLLGLLND